MKPKFDNPRRLIEEYRKMAEDQEHEREALEWIEGFVSDGCDCICQEDPEACLGSD